MNIAHLKYAVEVEKTASITKAAENLFMGQPNLSRGIKELERRSASRSLSVPQRALCPHRRERSFSATPRVFWHRSKKWSRFISPKRIIS